MKKVSLNPMNSKTQTKQQPPKVMPQKSDVTKEKPDLQAQTASASKDKVKNCGMHFRHSYSVLGSLFK